MKSGRFLFVAAAGLATLLSAVNAAAPVPPKPAVHDSDLRAPVPIKVVPPTMLPEELKGATVQFAFTVDEAGVPHNITAVTRLPAAVTDRLLPVLSQWRFTPATQAGVPVALRVVLPIKLIEES